MVSKSTANDDFNPRSREGSDSGSLHGKKVPEISIHAPARGATRLVLSCGGYTEFQSTLPRGERHTERKLAYRTDDFNPRSREGSDHGLQTCRRSPARFQSTLPRGERPLLRYATQIHPYFNPRSREGSDFIKVSDSAKFKNFNPRSREGSDPPIRRGRSLALYFNPRSREGSDILPVLSS